MLELPFQVFSLVCEMLWKLERLKPVWIKEVRKGGEIGNDPDAAGWRPTLPGKIRFVPCWKTVPVYHQTGSMGVLLLSTFYQHAESLASAR